MTAREGMVGASVADAWQPIETAPRDGRTFLAARFVEDEEPYYEVGRYRPLEIPRGTSMGSTVPPVRELAAAARRPHLEVHGAARGPQSGMA